MNREIPPNINKNQAETEQHTIFERREAIVFDENLLNIDISQYKNQMVGKTPGVDAEDILNINKGFCYFLKNLDLNNPSDLISKLFNIDRGVTWICESLYSEIKNVEKTKIDNTQLKEYLQKSIQNLMDCYCSVLDTNKVGYLTELVIQDSFSRLKFACFSSGIKIMNGAFDIKHNGPANLPYAVSIPNKPNSKERDFQRGLFLNKGEVFRIKGGYLDKQNIDGSWTSIDDIKQYTDINSKLVNSGNIINLMTFDNFLKDNYGIPINDISFAEKIYLYNYLLTNSYYKLQFNFKPSLSRQLDKTSFIRTFLSIEQGGKEMGDKIIGLGEKLPEEVAKKVFEKYGEIINTADDIENEIKKIFGDKDVPNRVLVSVKETLLKRGAKMLSDLGDKVLDPKFEINETEILKELDEIREEALILGESYVGLYKEGIRVPIDDVTTTKETPTENLSEKQKEELIKIYEKGRPKVTYESKEHLDFLKNEFKEELNNKDISVTEICFKNETIIIALIDKKDKDNLFVGGLTFVEEVKNAVVAEATMSHVLKKFKDKNIKALVDSRNPLLNMYLKRFDFRITKRLDSSQEIKDNGGEIYVEIEKLKEQVEEELKFKIAA